MKSAWTVTAMQGSETAVYQQIHAVAESRPVNVNGDANKSWKKAA
jgi:hypothetical protein